MLTVNNPQCILSGFICRKKARSLFLSVKIDIATDSRSECLSSTRKNRVVFFIGHLYKLVCAPLPKYFCQLHWLYDYERLWLIDSPFVLSKFSLNLNSNYRSKLSFWYVISLDYPWTSCNITSIVINKCFLNTR